MATPPPRSTSGMSVMRPILSGEDCLDGGGELARHVLHEQVFSVADYVAAADDDVVDVGGGGGEDGRLDGQVVFRAGGAGAVHGDGDQVGPGTGDDLARVGPAQAGVAVRGGGLEQGLGGEVAAGLVRQAF